MSEKGINDVNMDEVAAYAGASKMTVYKYFVDKKTLFGEVGKTVISQHIEKISEVTHSEMELTQKMQNFLAISTEFVDSGRYKLCEELSAELPEMRKAYRDYQQAFQQKLETLIEAGMTKNLFRPELSVRMVCDYIIMGIVYYQHDKAYRRRMKEDGGFREQMVKFLVGNIFV